MRSLITRRKHVDLTQAIAAFYDPNTPIRDAVVLWRKALRRADKAVDRGRAHGKRLDIPAGTAVRFEPGERKTVQLVAIAGAKVVWGGNALGEGPVTPESRARLVAAAVTRGSPLSPI